MRREKPAVIVLIVLALLCVVAGIVYITVLPKNLPSFFPGHVAKHAAVTSTTRSSNGAGAVTPATNKPARKHKATTSHYWKRGVVLFIVAAILLALAWSMSNTRRRMLRHR